MTLLNSVNIDSMLLTNALEQNFLVNVRKDWLRYCFMPTHYPLYLRTALCADDIGQNHVSPEFRDVLGLNLQLAQLKSEVFTSVQEQSINVLSEARGVCIIDIYGIRRTRTRRLPSSHCAYLFARLHCFWRPTKNEYASMLREKALTAIHYRYGQKYGLAQIKEFGGAGRRGCGARERPRARRTTRSFFLFPLREEFGPAARSVGVHEGRESGEEVFQRKVSFMLNALAAGGSSLTIHHVPLHHTQISLQHPGQNGQRMRSDGPVRVSHEN
ncbi:hypothetical protein EVAR_35964_1 [Eumeta japonica]|uniref:Uncharacterized protein n=1 Tax=Eumeta variegata TaxID=151549 RepID=A0A4C1W6D7_EUMVA|nr:hypothetical protein EVAR_35964_1 [Eumeta japonica]